MIAKSATEIISSIQNGDIKPVYILHGDEDYFIDLATDYIENNLLSDSDKAFNQTVAYGREVSYQQIYDMAVQFPMMAQRKLIIIKEAQHFKELKKLGEYIDRCVAHTVLVIAHKTKKIDGRLTWMKSAKKNEKVVILTSETIKEWNLNGWIDQYLQSKGRKIDPAARQLLADYLGADLSKLTNEIAKLELNIDEDAVITTTHIEKYVGISKDYNIFELVRALSSRDIARIHLIMDNITRHMHKHPIQMLIPAMFNTFQKALLVSRYSNQSDGQLAKLLKVNPRFLRDYKNLARYFKPLSLAEVFSELSKADQKSKGVGNRSTPSEEIFRELILRIIALMT